MQGEWDSLTPPWRACLELMWEAYAANTIPVGAVLVNGKGDVVARGRNGVYEDAGTGKDNRLLSHAEFNVLCGLDPEQRYEDHTVYGSLEPCLLCVGATVMATVGTLRFAGADPYAGAAGFGFTNPHIDRLDFSLEGPRDDAFGRLATSLHVEFFLRRNPGGHVVRVYRERLPQAMELAIALTEADVFALSQQVPTLEGALMEISHLMA